MSTKYKIIIIDDESLARDVIKKYLEDYSEIEIAAECDNGFEAIKAINAIRPNLIFLDIQMPKLTGFEMLELLENPPVIIFTTAYDQYALKAFEVSAADYLLKPFSRERFNEAIEKALKFINDSPASQEKVDKLLSFRETKSDYLDRIVVKDGSKITVIPVEKLIRLEAQDDYVMIYSKGGKFLKQKTMKFYETHLNPKDFIRIHSSHLVRVALIKQIDVISKNAYETTLANGEVLPVSKSGYQKLKEIL